MYKKTIGAVGGFGGYATLSFFHEYGMTRKEITYMMYICNEW